MLSFLFGLICIFYVFIIFPINFILYTFFQIGNKDNDNDFNKKHPILFMLTFLFIGIFLIAFAFSYDTTKKKG